MEFPLKLSAGFLKKSYARRMFYDLWKLALAYIAILVFVCTRYGEPAFTGWAIFFLSVMGLGVVIFSGVWFHQAKSIDGWIRSQGDAPIRYALSEDAVETTAQMGSTKLKWDAFAGLTITDFDTLLTLPQRGGALTLHTDQVPREAIEYLKDRFKAHGKKIEDKRRKG
jgi:hypothetical protein